MPQVLSAPLIDHRRLDLDAAARVTYILEQSFRYEYETPVASLRQRLSSCRPRGTAASTGGHICSR